MFTELKIADSWTLIKQVGMNLNTSSSHASHLCQIPAHLLHYTWKSRAWKTQYRVRMLALMETHPSFARRQRCLSLQDFSWQAWWKKRAFPEVCGPEKVQKIWGDRRETHGWFNVCSEGLTIWFFLHIYHTLPEQNTHILFHFISQFSIVAKQL